MSCSAIAAEGVQLVCDFGVIMEKVIGPAVGTEAKTILEALLMFERYYENCEMFDLYTHGIGPGIVGIVVHKLIDYLGGVCKEKLRHDKQTPLSYAPLAVYVSKIKSIVGTVVVDDVEEGTGRLKKADEVKKAAAVVVETTKPTDAPKVKKKTNIKHTERKRHQVSSSVHEVQVVDSDSSESSESSGVSCDSDEKQFTTITSPQGLSYKPPDKHLKPSRYSGKKEEVVSIETMEKQLNNLKSVFKQRETEVAKLKRENKQALDKLDRLGKGSKDTVQKQLSEDYKATAETKTKKRKKEKKKSPAPYVGFVASQIRTDLSSEDEDIQCSQMIRPDSTQSRKRKSSENAPSEAGSVITEHRHKRKRHPSDTGRSEVSTVKLAKSGRRIDSDSESVSSDDSFEALRRQKEQLSDKYDKLEAQMLEQRMDTKARDFQDEIGEAIRDLRSAMFMACGQETEALQIARQQLDAATVTVQSLGYKFTVSEQFRERIERCINCGQIPEKKLRCLRTDNSENDPITGPTVDIVYEVFMPVIVKEERMDDEDDDLQVLGVTPAPRLPLQALNIKDGKVVRPEQSVVPELKTTSEKEEKCADKSEEKMPDVGNKGEVREAGKVEAAKLHPAKDTPEKPPQKTQSDSENEVDVLGSQTPRKQDRKRPADSDSKCESDEETKADAKRRKKAAAAPTAMSLRNRDRPAK